MAKLVSKDQLDTVLKAVAQFPNGATIEEISHALTTLPRRTLQRRLASLVAQKQIIIEGHKRGSRYRLPPTTTSVLLGEATENPIFDESDEETYIPVSREGASVRAVIRQLIHHRHPVGYNRSFLDAYRPNTSYYLPPKIRTHLRNIGGGINENQVAGTYIRHILNRLLIDLSWNSSRLEGNTYSLLETERLLQWGEVAEGKATLEAQMILNHKAAIEFLVEQASEITFNRYSILNLHALLSDNLLADPYACGRLRHIPVGIAQTVYHPLEVPQLIEEAFNQILDTAAAIQDPFEQAFFVMVHLPYLQPFEDVNKRVSRLAANIPLIGHNLSPLSFVDVPEQAYIDGILGVYELNRIELLRDVFIWAYERSCARYSAVQKSLGEPDPFRLRYRTLIAEIIAHIVRDKLDKKSADLFIKHQAMSQEVSQKDRSRFIEVVETEIMSLHEGNIARYRLKPSEYELWKKLWI